MDDDEAKIFSQVNSSRWANNLAPVPEYAIQRPPKVVIGVVLVKETPMIKSAYGSTKKILKIRVGMYFVECMSLVLVLWRVYIWFHSS